MVTSTDLPDSVKWFANHIESNELPSDGLVLLMDDISYGESLGNTAKFPRNAMAFKWKDETAETTLREIHWSPSRTGLINPVAVFDPVELEGTTITRASVHNVSIVESFFPFRHYAECAFACSDNGCRCICKSQHLFQVILCKIGKSML